ncbi:septal ring lytic transglycosylase RlpA family protein [Candidatus Peribacteria bacterium]|nr:septal ring lytic transglycosylase RlpA family protein [Candidatus Peribacteria bacterium]
MRDLDFKLASEEHEVSLYSEKFHGKGTAFGETFDMHALTAAHRSFPHNTLVRVRNVSNDKSVVVRINDRGPFVQGRNMDLSLASFTSIAERSLGKIQVTFERLGDVNLVKACRDIRLQRRIVRDVLLSPGIPHSFALGSTLDLTSDQSFVVRDIEYPDGVRLGTQTWLTDGEIFSFTPAIIGSYRFFMGTKTGRVREMRMEVTECQSV